MRSIFRARRRRSAVTVSTGPIPPLPECGWALVEVLAPEQVAALRQVAERVLPAGIESYYSLNVHAPRELAQAADQELKALVSPALAAVVPGHDPFLAVVIAKGAGTEGVVGFHQDWTFTDERRDRAVLCWMPLVDTDERSGAMRVVSGSHRWTGGLRPSGPSLPTDPFPADLQERLGAIATTVPMRAGQALVYDPGLVHGSWPNEVDRVRPAVAVALAPSGAQLVHFHDAGDGHLQGFAIEGAHFTANEFGSMPVGVPEVEAWAPAVRVEEISQAAAAAG